MSHTQEPVTQEPASKPQDDAPISQTAASNSQAAASKPPENEPLNREIISAAAAKPEGDTKAREDIEKLRRDYHELREKLNTVRENDILTLKEKTSALTVKFYAAAAVVGLISFFGVKFFYSDLDRIVEERVRGRIDSAIDYNQKMLRAWTLDAQGDLQNSIELYEELFDQRADEEITFLRLLDCLNRAKRYKDALPYIDRARKSGFLAEKYKYLLSFNNAGYLVLIASTEDPTLRPEACDLLRQAEKIGSRTDDDQRKVALMNLVLYYSMTGEAGEARKYGRKIRDIEGDNWQWTPSPGDLLDRLKRVRTSIVQDMKDALSIDKH